MAKTTSFEEPHVIKSAEPSGVTVFDCLMIVAFIMLTAGFVFVILELIEYKAL